MGMGAYFVKECTVTKSANGREYCAMVLVSESGAEDRCYVWETNESWLWHVFVFQNGLPGPNKSGFISFKITDVLSDLGIMSPTNPALWEKYTQWQSFIPQVVSYERFSGVVAALLAPWTLAAESGDLSPRESMVMELYSRLPALYESYAGAFGGKKHHHAFKGGLVQHVFEMLTFAFGLRKWFPWDVDLFVLTFAILYHDYGKLEEYVSETADYTEQMVLWPHPVASAFHFKEIYGKFISESLMQRILHCIISHTGRKEWCVAQLPSTIEAFLLSEIDLMSAWGNTIAGVINMDYVSGMDRRVVNSKVSEE